MRTANNEVNSSVAVTDRPADPYRIDPDNGSVLVPGDPGYDNARPPDAKPRCDSDGYLVEEPQPRSKKKDTTGRASRRGVGRPFIYTWRDAYCAMPAAELTATQRHVLWTVSLHMNPDGTNAYQSQERIAREAALNLRTVRRCLKQLEQLGWLRRERIYKDGPPPRQLVGCRYTAAIPETAKQVAIEKSKAVPPGGCTPPGEGVGVDSAVPGGCSGTNLGVVGPPTSSSTRTTPTGAAAPLRAAAAAPVKQKAEVPQQGKPLRTDWRRALANLSRNPRPSLIRPPKAEVSAEEVWDAVPEGRLMGGEC